MSQRCPEEADRSETAIRAAQLAQALTGPLNSLLAMGELLQRQSLPETARSQLQAMLDVGRRMSDMVCDAVEMEGFASPAAAVPTSLRTLVDDVEARWRSPVHDEASHFLISSNASSDLRIMTDPVRLRRLLNTLIQDALNVRAWGVVELQLTVVQDTDASVCIEGRLNAPGASPLSCNPVALNLCRTIIDQLGGSLTTARSAGLGVDTIFAFKACEAGRDAVSPIDDGEEDGPLPRGTHLLIVDDNATNRIVAAALCEMFGCTSETAEDGLEAVEAVKSRPFDLILMDIKMPRMDGLMATQAIRALPSAAACIPIIALTANADADATASYLVGGMQAVVNKPIKPDQLLSTLQWALSRPVEAAPSLSSTA